MKVRGLKISRILCSSDNQQYQLVVHWHYSPDMLGGIREIKAFEFGGGYLQR